MKRLWQLVLLGVLLVAVVAVVFYRRPFWVAQQATHLGLFLSHVQSNYVLTPEGRVHYYEAESRVVGGGIPLVLVHGLADRDESWAPMLKRLKRAGFHVYAPDLMGAGRSPKAANGDYSIAAQSQFVTDFIQALGLQKTDLGGWSMGGWIALDAALKHPELIDRVVVYDSAGIFYDLPWAKTVFHPHNTEEMAALIHRLEPEQKPLPPFVLRAALRRLQGNQEVVDKELASMLAGHDLVDSRLPAMPEPLLIVWGSVDGLLPLGMGEKMHALDPRSELDVVEGCGHLAPLNCAPRVAAATADFLRANPAPVGGVRRLANMH